MRGQRAYKVRGDLLHSTRLRRGLTVVEAAKLAEVAKRTWEKAEGNNGPVELPTVRKLAAFVGGIEPGDLLAETGEVGG